MTDELKPLEEKEIDVAYDIGLVREWLAGAKNPATPDQITEAFQEIVTGINFYREKYIMIQQDLIQLQNNYNALAGQSALYLEQIQQQRQHIDQLLIDDQREVHKKDE